MLLFGLVSCLLFESASIDLDVKSTLDTGGEHDVDCLDAEMCDGVDNDCDGELSPDEMDLDGDGYVACLLEDDWFGADSVIGGADCDDTNPLRYPTAEELPGDGVDQDCDGQEICFLDEDADGFGGLNTESRNELDCIAEGLSSNQMDCDDTDASINPNGAETYYNGIDEDCDGFSDYDADLDGQDATEYGGLDCDDTDPNIYNSDVIIEGIADGVDQNCDGFELCFVDVDGDGFGDPNASIEGDMSCSGQGLSSNQLDCDDSHASVNPDAEEICDGLANICNSNLPASETDDDGDGYVECQIDLTGWQGSSSVVAGMDCDDSDASTYPSATEIWYDGQDQGCDGGSDYDQDGDGQDALVGGGADCDDLNPSVYFSTSITEIPLDGVDQNCDGFEECYEDVDGDGFGTSNLIESLDLTCSSTGVSLHNTDCADANDTVYPNAPELCDGVVNVCGTTLSTNETDDDGDGFVECSIDVGGWDGTTLVVGGDDCDDSEMYAYPGAASADSSTDCMLDMDQDGYGDATTGQLFTVGTDCDDLDETIYPSALELCDGIVNNCGTSLPISEIDDDGDGFVECSIDLGGWDGSALIVDGGDCDDGDATIHPEALDVEGDGIDQDCDGSDATITLLTVADLQPGDLVITEVSPSPRFAINPWFEVVNNTSIDIDLQGLVGSSLQRSVPLNTSVILPPGAFIVLTENASWSWGGMNQGIFMEEMDLNMNRTDWIVLSANNQTIAEVDFSQTILDRGVSYVPEFMFYGPNLPIELWCPSRTVYSYVNTGTPGLPNDLCDDDGDGDHWDSDCDDNDPMVYNGAIEIWYDGIDQDCDGWSDYDQDMDGEDVDLYGGDDCDDTNPFVNTFGLDFTMDGVDQDCDGIDGGGDLSGIQ